MRQILLIGIFVVLAERLFAGTLPVVDCKCEVLECGPCETEIDIKFYSEKCGDNLTRMKSCKKSVCEAVANQDKCFSDLGIEQNNFKKAQTPELRSRTPASDVLPIGFVETSFGKPQIIRTNQKTQFATKGFNIFEDDRILTDNDSKLKIQFTKTKDELHINANSNIFIQHYLHPTDLEENPEYKKTLIKLDLGKIRIRVSPGPEKYDRVKNTFEIKTKTAVAGVRGTDFVMSYDEVTKASGLQTLTGAVELSAQNASETNGLPVLVTAGEECQTSYKAEISELMSVKKLDAKSLRLIDQATEVKEFKGAASKDSVKGQGLQASNSVCNTPSAEFKECAWFCEGNPKNEGKCRTDLKEVSCIRKMCGANGQWILPTRMPSSQGKQCSGKLPVKGPCGDFW